MSCLYILDIEVEMRSGEIVRPAALCSWQPMSQLNYALLFCTVLSQTLQKTAQHSRFIWGTCIFFFVEASHCVHTEKVGTIGATGAAYSCANSRS